MAYLMLRPLADDVPDDDMCSVKPNQVFPAGGVAFSLLEGLSGIPDVEPGDSVWWHCDMIHSVAPVNDQQGWGNVMYIPAAPWCEKNARYAEPCVRHWSTDGARRTSLRRTTRRAGPGGSPKPTSTTSAGAGSASTPDQGSPGPAQMRPCRRRWLTRLTR